MIDPMVKPEADEANTNYLMDNLTELVAERGKSLASAKAKTDVIDGFDSLQAQIIKNRIICHK